MEMKIIKGLALETRKPTLILTALVIGSFISIYQTVSLNVALPGFMRIIRYRFEYSTVADDWVYTSDRVLLLL